MKPTWNCWICNKKAVAKCHGVLSFTRNEVSLLPSTAVLALLLLLVLVLILIVLILIVVLILVLVVILVLVLVVLHLKTPRLCDFAM